ncbi:MAG: iron ABC transporter permease [Variibacter sp.]|nr:iron ABC transporter permease [Variibacter sp.]
MTLLAFAVAALVALPIVSLIGIALQGDGELWPHLAAHVLPHALVQTALLLAGATALAGLLGATTAWLVTTFDFPGRNSLAWLLPLPLAISTYIAAYVYVDLLDSFGPVQAGLRALFGWESPADYWFPAVRSLPGAIAIFGLVLYPYVYLAARAMMQMQCAVLSDAARILGARPLALARDISLPMARPAVAVGMILVALETLNDIGATEYLGVQTLTLSIFTTWLNRSSLPGAAQIAVLTLLLIGLLIALERFNRGRQRYAASLQDAAGPARIRLRGPAAWLATGACLTPVTLGFFIPVAALVREVVRRGLLTDFDATLVRHALTTIGLAAAATVTVLVLALAVTLPQRFAPHPAAAMAGGVASLGYALPGTVLALGLLAPLVAADAGIAATVRALTGYEPGLVLIGSGAALVIAYAVRFLSIGVGFAQAGLARMPVELDEMARLLGARPLGLVRKLHVPLLRPALASAALLVFVDCLKELPATLLLRPLNVETLSTYIYQFASRGNFEEGALAALLIVAAGILPVMRMTRHAETASNWRSA